MKDRIQELKLQAGIEHNPDQEGLDLFAELIVDACAELADCPNSFKHRSGNKIRRYFDVEKQLA
jgi:hypothetical protein